MLPTIEQLQRMQNMNIMELHREQLANAKDIVIDTEKSAEERIRSFIGQTGNPFALNVGEYILQTGFMEGTDDLIDERMQLLVQRKTRLAVTCNGKADQEGMNESEENISCCRLSSFEPG